MIILSQQHLNDSTESQKQDNKVWWADFLMDFSVFQAIKHWIRIRNGNESNSYADWKDKKIIKKIKTSIFWINHCYRDLSNIDFGANLCKVHLQPFSEAKSRFAQEYKVLHVADCLSVTIFTIVSR